MAPIFACICGNNIPRSESQHDFKCPNCGRVYNYQGNFLWKESPGNDVPGSSDIESGGVGLRAEDQKPGDPEAPQQALEKAFEEGILPEVPRRATDEELDRAEDDAIAALEADRAARKSKR